jgi:hypothetical protein
MLGKCFTNEVSPSPFILLYWIFICTAQTQPLLCKYFIFRSGMVKISLKDFVTGWRCGSSGRVPAL